MNANSIVRGLKRADEMRAEIRSVVSLICGYLDALSACSHDLVECLNAATGYEARFSFNSVDLKKTRCTLLLFDRWPLSENLIWEGHQGGIPNEFVKLFHRSLDKLIEEMCRRYPRLRPELSTLESLADA